MAGIPHSSTSRLRRIARSPQKTSVRCHSQFHPHEAYELAAADPGLLQDIIVGSAVLIAVGSALYLSLKKEPLVKNRSQHAAAPPDTSVCYVPQVCDLCSGTGGIKCFACEGGGKMMSVPLDAVTGLQRRNPLGVASNPRQCRACTGSGLLLCRKCKGAGFVT